MVGVRGTGTTGAFAALQLKLVAAARAEMAKTENFMVVVVGCFRL